MSSRKQLRVRSVEPRGEVAVTLASATSCPSLSPLLSTQSFNPNSSNKTPGDPKTVFLEKMITRFGLLVTAKGAVPTPVCDFVSIGQPSGKKRKAC